MFVVSSIVIVCIEMFYIFIGGGYTRFGPAEYSIVFFRFSMLYVCVCAIILLFLFYEMFELYFSVFYFVVI